MLLAIVVFNVVHDVIVCLKIAALVLADGLQGLHHSVPALLQKVQITEILLAFLLHHSTLQAGLNLLLSDLDLVAATITPIILLMNVGVSDQRQVMTDIDAIFHSGIGL